MMYLNTFPRRQPKTHLFPDPGEYAHWALAIRHDNIGITGVPPDPYLSSIRDAQIYARYSNTFEMLRCYTLDIITRITSPMHIAQQCALILTEPQQLFAIRLSLGNSTFNKGESATGVYQSATFCPPFCHCVCWSTFCRLPVPRWLLDWPWYVWDSTRHNSGARS